MSTIKKEIFEVLRGFAVLYGNEKITQERLEGYTNILSTELTVAELKKAIPQISIKCKTFPSIAEIVELARPKVNANEEANIVANKIIECISRFGPYQGKELKEFLGDDYFIAERFGWQELCRITYDDIPTARAQLRELAKAYYSKRTQLGVEKLSQISDEPKMLKDILSVAIEFNAGES